MNDYTIWVSYHRDEQVEKYHLHEDEHHRLFPTHKKPELPININILNPVYSEMVTMYYVYANYLYSPLVGFEHYRRHLDIRQLPKRGECVIYTRAHFTETIYDQYCRCHCGHDMDDMLEILEAKYGKDNPYSKHILNDKVLIANCTFLMPWDDFSAMCKFMFNNLYLFSWRNLDNYRSITNEEELAQWRQRTARLFKTGVNYQTRVLSFLAERLISAWITHEMKIIN